MMLLDPDFDFPLPTQPHNQPADQSRTKAAVQVLFLFFCQGSTLLSPRRYEGVGRVWGTSMPSIFMQRVGGKP